MNRWRILSGLEKCDFLCGVCWNPYPTDCVSVQAGNQRPLACHPSAGGLNQLSYPELVNE